ncbi:MAG: hypothetical protein KME05_07505 [Gloeocapsa sp. UFS-A4-WI-NPMV-4B04]|nr:hypothetical protein [Gloeocapsa sp. UFS-A4-WI-NPMV-4B04]
MRFNRKLGKNITGNDGCTYLSQNQKPKSVLSPPLTISRYTKHNALVRAIAPSTMLQPQRLLKCYKRIVCMHQNITALDCSVSSHEVKPLSILREIMGITICCSLTDTPLDLRLKDSNN